MDGALLDRGRRLYERALFLVGQSDGLIQRSQADLARGRQLLQRHTKRRASSSLIALIRLKLQDGRLPRASAPIILGGPGGGKPCAACNRPLLKRHLVMDIPAGDGRVVRLHASCYMLWNAERSKSTESRFTPS